MGELLMIADAGIKIIGGVTSLIFSFAMRNKLAAAGFFTIGSMLLITAVIR